MIKKRLTFQQAVAKLDFTNDVLFDFSCGRIKDMKRIIKKQCQSIEIHLKAKKRQASMLQGVKG